MHFASPASPVHYERLALETMAVNALGTMHAVRCAHGAARRCCMLRRAKATAIRSSTRSARRTGETSTRSGYDHATTSPSASAKRTSRPRFASSARRARRADLQHLRPAHAGRRRPRHPELLRAALRGEALTVYGDGSQTRSFCYVDDLVDGICGWRRDRARRPRGQLGNPEEYTIRELAEITARLAGVRSRRSPPLPPDDPTRRRPDITLARALLAWEPVVPLEDGLARTLSYFAAGS